MAGKPVVVTFDHPRRHLGRRLHWGSATAAGWALVAAATVALVVAVPTGFFVLGFVVDWVASEDATAEPWPPPDMPVDKIWLGWAVSMAVVVVGFRVGLRLLRRGRHLVLFLRRFGNDDATAAVTFAVARSIGTRWRLVTLDDAEIAPLGVMPSARRLLLVGTVLSRTVRSAARVVTTLFQSAVWALVAIGALAVWRAGGIGGLEAGTLDPYLDVMTSIMELRLPLHAFGLDLLGIFALLATILAIALALLFIGFGGLLLAFPLAGVIGVVNSAASAARLAEARRTAFIVAVDQIDDAVSNLAALRGRVLAPRLVVLRVATAAWQDTVRRLADIASVALIDVSDPSEHLLWELQALHDGLGRTAIFVGHHDRVARYGDPSYLPAPASLAARMAPFLEGREILAYASDRRASRRFARELRDRLLEVSLD